MTAPFPTPQGPAPRRVRVDLAARSYDVLVGPRALDALPESVITAAGAAARPRAFLIYDDGLPAETVARAGRVMSGRGIAFTSTPTRATEADKSLTRLAAILAVMAREKLERRDVLVALGGGIVGDLAGFAAAAYRRGIPFIQCPTTLLAMVDASVGGKTGVNLDVDGSLKKNMAGAFHQPRAVIADVSTLASLPPRHLRAGLAECIKHGLIAADHGGPGLLDWTEENLDAILRLEPGPLVELVARNVAVKARVVAGDEFETAPDHEGGRALLNLGHTFGHAIETLPGLSPDGDPAHAPLLHGEAVALGLAAAAATAIHSGSANPALAARLGVLLARAGLPAKVRGLPSNRDLLALMAHDKKVAGGRLRLVLPVEPGRARIVPDPDPRAVEAGLDAIRA